LILSKKLSMTLIRGKGYSCLSEPVTAHDIFFFKKIKHSNYMK